MRTILRRVQVDWGVRKTGELLDLAKVLYHWAKRDFPPLLTQSSTIWSPSFSGHLPAINNPFRLQEVERSGVHPEGTTLANSEMSGGNDISLIYPWLHISARFHADDGGGEDPYDRDENNDLFPPAYLTSQYGWPSTPRPRPSRKDQKPISEPCLRTPLKSIITIIVLTVNININMWRGRDRCRQVVQGTFQIVESVLPSQVMEKPHIFFWSW